MDDWRQADYRAVLSAINALGAGQREQSLRSNRSADEHLAEIKDLIIGGR